MDTKGWLLVSVCDSLGDLVKRVLATDNIRNRPKFRIKLIDDGEKSMKIIG